MPVWWDTFNSGFWLSITSLLLAAVAIGFKACYKSKCYDLNCCFGLIQIKRDVKLEERFDLLNPSSSEKFDQIPTVT